MLGGGGGGGFEVAGLLCNQKVARGGSDEALKSLYRISHTMLCHICHNADLGIDNAVPPALPYHHISLLDNHSHLGQLTSQHALASAYQANG